VAKLTHIINVTCFVKDTRGVRYTVLRCTAKDKRQSNVPSVTILRIRLMRLEFEERTGKGVCFEGVLSLWEGLLYVRSSRTHSPVAGRPRQVIQTIKI
jgi:hypothetical protein